MALYFVRESDLSAIANAIRSVCGVSESLTYPEDFIDTISAL